ncbi:unnamed protein product (mitochondrion) [Plasmodiophora brassicae]|uniref:Nucleotide-diphospho-sugar transferase domain-containing protein n=1 Tax=Plasmodiophora brassicae TaxID=37360 RepID=A0A0G4IWQ9_PLABS|nr:hypothetical protein PBRA_007317 [Plasmodiophora brassicae]SPQ95918.1 unnamed protein product [Plasmodiophora brassicae]
MGRSWRITSRLRAVTIASAVISTWYVGFYMQHTNRLLTSSATSSTTPAPIGIAPSWPPTRAMLVNIVDADNRVTAIGVNFDYIDIAELLAESIERVGVTNLVIVALDRDAYDVLSVRFPERTFLPPFAASEAVRDAVWGTGKFKAVTSTRPKFILGFLEAGCNVFYVDTDTLWRRNPFPYFKLKDDGSDMMITGSVGNLCTGLIYVKARTAAIDAIRSWADHIDQGEYQDDQAAFNAMIAPKMAAGLRVHRLDDALFPDGRTMFQVGYDWTANPDGPIIIHANYLKGHDSKKAMLIDLIRSGRFLTNMGATDDRK